MIRKIQQCQLNGMIIMCMKCAIDVQSKNSALKRMLLFNESIVKILIICFPHDFFSDILKLRDIVRKNFLMYYAQENLFDLKARQIAENRIMDAAENFGDVTIHYFKRINLY